MFHVAMAYSVVMLVVSFEVKVEVTQWKMKLPMVEKESGRSTSSSSSKSENSSSEPFMNTASVYYSNTYLGYRS